MPKKIWTVEFGHFDWNNRRKPDQYVLADSKKTALFIIDKALEEYDFNQNYKVEKITAELFKITQIIKLIKTLEYR